MKTIIIAEAGVNHNGDLSMARRLIDVAAEAGADFVKFQTFRPERIVTKSAAKASYQDRGSGSAESQYEMLRRLTLTREMHEALIAHCAERAISFLSTPFDSESIQLLVEFGMERFKIPSGEINNLPYLRQVGSLGKSIILSTGMATLGEIEAALHVLESAGTPRKRITVLHCHTEYPTPVYDVNLRAMQTIRDAFGVDVGYSDHTLGIDVPIAAVALGATVIEKHFTLKRELTGPDHKASLEPRELGAMVSSIRSVEQALGDGIKRPTHSELMNRAVVRKSIVAARPIRTGELFDECNLAVKRPGTGICAMRWDDVIGRTASRDFVADELIEL